MISSDPTTSATQSILASSTTIPSPVRRSPPPLMLRVGDELVQPWQLGFCWAADGDGFCGDAVESDGPVVVADEPVVIDFPLAGWEFTAAADADCAGVVVLVERTVDGAWTIEVSGPEGFYPIDLRGEGPEGDVDYRFIAAMSGPSHADDPVDTVDRGAPGSCDLG
ncbi:MAG: hypothetical protein R2733_14535 [Acidimicrobiales bacterium]